VNSTRFAILSRSDCGVCGQYFACVCVCGGGGGGSQDGLRKRQEKKKRGVDAVTGDIFTSVTGENRKC
jgi:hypothetical protein